MINPSRRNLALVALLIISSLLQACSDTGPLPTATVGSAEATATTSTSVPTLVNVPINRPSPTVAVTQGSTGEPQGEPAGNSGECAVLFDNTTGQTAGNADWIISTSQPDPRDENPNPQQETDWTGGFSSWGVALEMAGGYRPMTLPRGERVSYGGGGSLDLQNFKVFVVAEPNNQFERAEQRAIVEFVRDGGGLFMISDHDNSDRDNDGWDSPAVWNDLLDNNGVAENPFGLRFDLANISSEDPKKVVADDPIANGPFGQVRGTILRSSTTISINSGSNSAARGIIYRNNAQLGGAKGAVLARSEYGSGRVVALGDSSPLEDETGQANNRLYDGWDDSAGDNSEMALNATAWLCAGGRAPDGPSATAAPAQSEPTAAASSCLTIANGNFESSDLSAWTSPINADFRVEGNPVHSGSGALAVTHNNTRDSGGAGGVETDIHDIREGTNYSLNGWVLFSDQNVESVRARIAWYNCDNFDCRSSNTDVPISGDSTGWQEFAAPIQAPNGARAARLRLQFYGSNSQTNTVYFDDLALACAR